ncbi:hypothetical protein [Leptospira andrefontaineae]|uniref:DUF1554 domain-containing protein n=1 Tax=Leptospira andrefontaineae TaxID=2484976 RepID=A0A4R9HD16_9LEPT|nr:hypothetical protein [Leptospira andrefontaineae]TGK44511.1 hypothetical protein EHO65_00285 [Leptospira andrefontaineae]
MKKPFYLFSFLLLFSNACMSSDVCSDTDKMCSTKELLFSIFSAPKGIYLYSTQSYQGDLANYGSSFEESLQNICTINKLFSEITDLSCSNVLPVVSTSTHYMSNFPTDYGLPTGTDYPVRGPRGDIIATSWTNMFAGLLISFEAAGVTSQKFWTFANGGGAYNSADNCIAGTNTGAAGAIGSPQDSGISWMIFGAPACSESHPIICLCYRN